MRQADVTIIGAGLVGSLLATLLAQQGKHVQVFEKRPDPRSRGFLGGRSINLALSERGIGALRAAGLVETILAQAVKMRGRMVHDADGNANLQPYGIDDSEVNWSVSRGGLNIQLLDAAAAAGAQLEFDRGLIDADFDAGTITLRDSAGNESNVAAGVILGADGAGSALRAAMNRAEPLGERVEFLDHGYKELEIPSVQGADPDNFRARFAIEPYALHIWPRGKYMCIALPNREGSFTVTLFLANHGEPSFEALPDSGAARALFEHDFADALALMPDFDADFTHNPVGSLATLYLDRWYLGSRALLVGDAAHAVVPFHGQGMNAAFEDAAELAPLLLNGDDNIAGAFETFQRQRKPNADAIATMALENYIEMRDSVADPHYLQKRALASALAEHAPRWFMPRYRMVTFTHLPYAYCLERGRQQDVLLERLLREHDVAGNIDSAITTLKQSLEPLPDLLRG